MNQRIPDVSEGDTSQKAALCRIMVVDDHPTFRRGLAAVLTGISEIKICGEAESALAALDVMRQSQPDIAVVDISLPGGNGIELIKAMLAECPKLGILVLSMHDESHCAIRALRAGAKGYLTKAESADQIIAAIRKIHAGGLYVSPRLSQRLIFKAIQSLDAGDGSEVDALSERELEVFRHLGKGLGTKDIADILKLSAKTVETHRAHIKGKFGCKNASEVVRFAIDWAEREEG